MSEIMQRYYGDKAIPTEEDLKARIAGLENMLIEALPYVEEGEQFNKDSRKGLSARIRKALGLK